MGKIKRLISVFLVLVMTVGILPSVLVSAQELEDSEWITPSESEQAENMELPEEGSTLPMEEEETTQNEDPVVDEMDDPQPEEETVRSVGTGDFVVTGGTLDRDYAFSNGVLTILTSTPLTIRNANPNTPTTHRILVPADVEAELVFDGVNIKTTDNSPFTLTPQVGGGAKAHIVLADNSENTLYCNSSNKRYAGLRAGETTTVIIDDSIVNRDTNGNDITPVAGKVPYDLTLENGTVLHKGDNLSLMDSPNRGKLSATGAYFGAGIGGASGEYGGNIIINGGIIEAQNNYPSDGYAAGIGGGTGGDGGNITINGGLIKAKGPYHAAGIGGGCHVPHSGGDLIPAAANPTLVDDKAGYSGNITINGGLSYSYGSSHGEAFGDGCVWVDHREKDYKIIVTGGTILPYYSGTRGDLGSRAGNVYVTGGSLKVLRFGQDGMKQKVYGDLEGKTEVLQALVSMEYLGTNKVNTVPVEDFELLIGGKKTAYGAPSYTDDKGILYLWLPSDSQGKEATVNTAVTDKETGETIQPDSFFITNVTHNSKLKQYSSFVIADDIVPHEQMTKRYDGIPFDKDVSKTFLDTIMKDGGIPVENPKNGKLNDKSAMTISSRRLDDETLEPDTDYEGGALSAQSDAGKYELVITSTQYANEPIFRDAYWGHRGYYKYAEIVKAVTETRLTANQVDAVKPGDTISFEAHVRPAQNEGTACAAPRGSVQFYVDGRKYGEPVELTTHNDVKEDNHYYSTATLELALKDVEGLLFKNEKVQVRVEYLGEDINYTNGTTAE